jgi:hypothetical protein
MISLDISEKTCLFFPVQAGRKTEDEEESVLKSIVNLALPALGAV